jgi:hypothetical protein
MALGTAFRAESSRQPTGADHSPCLSLHQPVVLLSDCPWRWGGGKEGGRGSGGTASFAYLEVLLLGSQELALLDFKSWCYYLAGLPCTC